MSHTHWDQALIERLFLPPYPVPSVCPFRTKKLCNEFYTQWSHGHPGAACQKRVEPGNVMATCYLRTTPSDD